MAWCKNSRSYKRDSISCRFRRTQRGFYRWSFRKCPADKGGIKSGDIILEFDGEKIKTMRNLPRVVANTKPNKKLTLKFGEIKKLISKKFTLGRMESAEEFKDK